MWTRPINLRGIVSPLERGLVGVAMAVAIVTLGLSINATLVSLQERLFDSIGNLRAPSLHGEHPIVVDIDRATLEAVGPWPWSRDKIARLIGLIADAGPKAVALDILFDGPDQRSPAALARGLADITGDDSLRNFASRLADGDSMLAASLARTRAVLGVVVDPGESAAAPDLRPVFVQGAFDASGLWYAGSLIAPATDLMSVSEGLGSLVLLGGEDGSVRQVPLLTHVGNYLVPCLALELLRVAVGQPFLIVDGPGGVLRVGDRELALGQNGLLRLLPHVERLPGARRLSAERILARDSDAVAALKDAVLIVGGSAPEIGGLRPQADGSLVASSDLHANAYWQLAAGAIPNRPAAVRWGETLAVLVASLLAALSARRFEPIRGVLVAAVAAAGWVMLAVGAGMFLLILVDPIKVPLAGIASFTLGALLVARDVRRRESRIRARFEQHLAPAVVRRIAEKPDSLRLKGEQRVVTALFTDVEGFTAMTNRATPEQLIEVLDEYFDGVTGIIVKHHGLVDKIVGDAVHALFNVPFDVEDHPRSALDCAIAIVQFTNEYRARPLAKKLGLGRTRIGLETGPAIVGDVGGTRKLDYTAHGTVVNTAARLEQANKDFGTTILIGHNAAAVLTADLMPLGGYAIRGMDERQQVFTTWPPGYNAQQRADYIKAITTAVREPHQAQALVAQLMQSKHDDPILTQLVYRLAARCGPAT